MYSTAFWCLIVVYWFFWLYCVTAVTPCIAADHVTENDLKSILQLHGETRLELTLL